MQLAAGMAGSTEAIVSLFWIALVALLMPLLARATRGLVPDTVLLLIGGVLIGPELLGAASAAGGVSLVSELGLGMLFLLAGYELDPEVLRSRTGRAATLTWLVCLVLAVLIALLLLQAGNLQAAVAVGIALTSTALGTLLPILKERGLADHRLGRAVMAHGATGELAPTVAMAVLLSSRSILAAVIVLALFGVLAGMVARLPAHLARGLPRVAGIFAERSGGTSQIVLRAVVLLLVTLMALAAVFDLDVVLGAFAAGAILRRLDPDENEALAPKLEALAYGLLVPVFFVVSGMGISLSAVTGEPLGLVVAVLLIVLARGVPVVVAERLVDTRSGLRGLREQSQLGLYAATGLPIIVAVTEVAASSGLLDEDSASVLVAAGGVTVLMFPLIALLLGGLDRRHVPEPSGT